MTPPDGGASVLQFRRHPHPRVVDLNQHAAAEREARQAIGSAVLSGGDVQAATKEWRRVVVALCRATLVATQYLSSWPAELAARWERFDNHLTRGGEFDEQAMWGLMSETLDHGREVLLRMGIEPDY